MSHEQPITNKLIALIGFTLSNTNKRINKVILYLQLLNFSQSKTLVKLETIRKFADMPLCKSIKSTFSYS